MAFEILHIMFKWLMILTIVLPLKVESLMCNEGINVTLLGLPFYHWKERECFGISSCFSQEISLKRDIPVSMRYGGCISKYYANQFTCKKLFGDDSNFNPSTLLNLVTDSDDFVESMAEDFRQNAAKYVHQLFSKGIGTKEFVEGIFTLNEAIGFNMSEVQKLKQPIADYLSAFLKQPVVRKNVGKYFAEVKKKQADLFKAIGNLNTSHGVSTDKLYSFFRGMSISPRYSIDDKIKASKYRRTFENFPGLVRSMISKDDDQALKWFDTIVNALSKFNALNLTQSANDMANEITTSFTMPTYAQKIYKYIFNSLFQCARTVNAIRAFGAYTPQCLNALLKFGDPDNYTIALTSKVTTLTSTISSSNALPLQLVEQISYFLHSLFRTFVPIATAEMNAAYQALIDGFDSFNYTNFDQTKRLDETKMSEFILGLLRRTNPDMTTSSVETLIINLSKTFYNVMTSEYETELDTFFTALISGFSQFPKVNSGTIVKDLFEKFGQKIPLGLRPLLNNLQAIIDSFTEQDTRQRIAKNINALQDLAKAYLAVFPTSKFPSLAMRYLTYMENTLSKLPLLYIGRSGYSECGQPTNVQNYTECIEGLIMKESFEYLKHRKQAVSIEIDLFFAVLEATGFTSDSFIEKALAKNQTALVAYARLLKSLNPEDVKELQNDYDMWMMNIFRDSDNYKFDNFILAVNFTTSKIITKMAQVMKDLRYVHAPESCRYVTCEDNGCNTHELINGVPVTTKAMMRGEAPQLSKEITTTPAGFALPLKSAIGLCLTLVLMSMNIMGL